MIEADFDDIEWSESEVEDEDNDGDVDGNVDQDENTEEEENVDEPNSEESEENIDERGTHRGHGMRGRKKMHRRKQMMRKEDNGAAGGRRRPMHMMHGKRRGPAGRQNYWQSLRQRFNKTNSNSSERWMMVQNSTRSHWAKIRQHIMRNRMKFNESSSNQTDHHSLHGHHHMGHHGRPDRRVKLKAIFSCPSCRGHSHSYVRTSRICQAV